MDAEIQQRAAEGSLTPTEQYLLDQLSAKVKACDEKDAEIERLWGELDQFLRIPEAAPPPPPPEAEAAAPAEDAADAAARAVRRRRPSECSIDAQSATEQHRRRRRRAPQQK